MHKMIRLTGQPSSAAALLGCLALSRLFSFDARAAGTAQPGLALTFTATGADEAKATDTMVSPGGCLSVAAGMPPTAFLAGAGFSADWTGFVSSEIRDNYIFQAELNGDLKLEINGAPVWEASARGTNTGPSKPVRLNKGTNTFKLHCVSPSQGDAWIRLSWSTREFAPEPLAPGTLSHPAMPELLNGDRLRLGRELFLEFRCGKCHSGPAPDAGVPELAMDAPSLEAIGSRRNGKWIARWIADPESLRPTARLPRLFHGPQPREDAENVAAFLASLKSDSPAREDGDPAGDQAEAGRKLFDTLHCIACHNTPGTTENDPQKIPLDHVRQKFVPGAMVACLRKPDENYAWSRMPDFKLTAEESARLAAFLQTGAEPPEE